MLIHSDEFDVLDLIGRLIAFWDRNDLLWCGRVMDVDEVPDPDCSGDAATLIEVVTSSGCQHHIVIEQFFGIMTEEEDDAQH